MPKERYEKLQEYLSAENPILLDVIEEYKRLDEIGYKLGFITPEETYTSTISWWPMISILGTFSAGKSTFINQYIDKNIQESGNQAIDDKFTVICYGDNEEPTTLPGLALDADPRFPFYNISDEVNKVDPGEGNRVNLYLQLKTLNSPKIKGKILIDSPGFDADSQRDGILRITSHIVDMSDLVLVFFDARHPEPGAMRDTLKHLVAATINHRDANKILYILNQIDTTAKEDNLETVIASWQRAMSQEGLISGNFYGIYNESSAIPIDDPAQSERLQRKKDTDLSAITERMDKVGIERAYRIIKALEDFSKQMRDEKIPTLQKALSSWSKKVIFTDILLIALISSGVTYLEIEFGYISKILTTDFMQFGALIGAILIVVALHFKIKSIFASVISKSWKDKDINISKAITHNTKWWRPIFGYGSSKWGDKSVKRLEILMKESRSYIQKLNDQFISPLGDKAK